MKGPKVLVLDIETAPLEVLAWGLFDQNIPVRRIQKDRSVLCVAAKWAHEKKVMVFSTKGQKDVRDDRIIMSRLHVLLSQADVVVTQNGNKFDIPIILGRFLVHGFGPPKPFKKVDTYLLARKLGLVSNRLEYLTQVLAPELKKSIHKKFPGDDLWIECLKGNRAAWKEMEAYNARDVLGTEAVYKKLAPFGLPVNFALYHKDNKPRCSCGSTNFERRGYAYTPAGKFQIHHCQDCGSWFRGTENLLSKEKKASLRRGA